MHQARIFLRFAHTAALHAASAPTGEEAIRAFLADICEHRGWLFGHARVFADLSVPTQAWLDIWHVGLANRLASSERSRAVDRLKASDDRFRRALRARRARCVDLPAKWAIALKSAWIAPLLAGGEAIGICEFLTERSDRNPLLLEILTHLGARLGSIVRQKWAEQHRRDLSVRLFHKQDEERRLLAGELHDTTGQSLTALLFDLNTIEHGARLNARARAALLEAKSLGQQSLREIRTLSYALHPPMLDELGFATALGIFVENFSRRSQTRITMDLPTPFPEFPADLQTTLFRIIQEGLTNAQRYAPGSSCRIRMAVDETALRLCVENDATASVPPALPVSAAQSGVGLTAARERVAFFGGTLTLRSAHRRTILEVLIPRSKALSHSA